MLTPTPRSLSTLGKAIFSLMGELIEFGVVMLVVMSGFVLSFYCILRDNLTFAEVRVSTASERALGEVFCLLRMYCLLSHVECATHCCARGEGVTCANEVAWTV